ncbi:MAG: hypothetical protein AAFW70_05550 [Cyanobacteria bacterium J06635_10]
MELRNPKASFDECYNLDSPKLYVSTLLKEKNYRLPFDAMELLDGYLKKLANSETWETVFFGSGYGLDVTALKYGYTSQDILDEWLDEKPIKKFKADNSRFKITLVDINKAPLNFAHEIGLCDRFFVCDLKEQWPEELFSILKNETKLLICVGATTYIGINRFNYIVNFVETSKIEYFCFSLPSFIENSYLQVFSKSKLHLQKLGDVRQRDYKDNEERLRIIHSLNLQNRYSPKDDNGLIASIYIASKTL